MNELAYPITATAALYALYHFAGLTGFVIVGVAASAAEGVGRSGGPAMIWLQIFTGPVVTATLLSPFVVLTRRDLKRHERRLAAEMAKFEADLAGGMYR